MDSAATGGWISGSVIVSTLLSVGGSVAAYVVRKYFVRKSKKKRSASGEFGLVKTNDDVEGETEEGEPMNTKEYVEKLKTMYHTHYSMLRKIKSKLIAIHETDAIISKVINSTESDVGTEIYIRRGTPPPRRKRRHRQHSRHRRVRTHNTVPPTFEPGSPSID